jgi:outer membrane protein assembly factor BamB
MNSAGRAAALLILALPLRALAQPPAPEPANLRGDSAQTRKRLTEAEQRLANNQPADAIDALQRVLDDAGDDLVTADGKQYQPARRFVHQILARLPADALKGYQDRLEGPARKLLDAAKQARDPAPLWQLLDRYFVSRPAEDGLLLLGDLLFEDGEFLAAEHAWRRLLPDAGADLVYPNPRTDPASVRARLILAAAFAGDLERARSALAAFKAKHPDAKGALAGRDGNYAATLQAVLDQSPAVPPPGRSGDWTTFGGGPERTGRVGARLPKFWPTGRPSWAEPLLSTANRHPAAPLGAPARPPFGHPVIAGGRVFVSDGTSLHGYDLLTGKAVAVPRVFGEPASFDPTKPPLPDPSPTLTAAGDRLYVRTGPPLVRPPDASKTGKAPEETSLVCIGPDPATGRLKVRWRLPAPGDSKTPTAWEGAPLVAGRRMWAVHARFEGGRVVHGIDCYDPADAATAPRLAWAADVCDSPLSTSGDPRSRQELLALAGRNVVFCSNTGAVVALDAVTGRRAWGFRYPRSRRADATRTPDPAPAVFAGGRLFVAPTDADRVYALDPETGSVVWESGTAEGAQILGVAAGKLVVSVTGPVRGLRGLSVGNGSSREPDGWVLSDTGGLLSYGRGFVTEGAVAWPTRHGLCLVSPRTGALLAPPFLNHLTGDQRGFFGNLAFADGVLVVVTPMQVWGYVTEAKRFGTPPERSGRDPVRARYEALVERADDSLASGNTAGAGEALLAATRPEFPAPLRAWAAARLLLLSPVVDGEANLSATVRAALPPELRGEWVFTPDGGLATLGALVARHTNCEPTVRPSPSPAACEPRTVEQPWLAPDAEVTRTVRLPPNSVPLRWLTGTPGVPKRVYTATPQHLFTLSLGEGDDSRHDAADHFTHAADLASGFVVAGPLAVAVYGSERAPVWVFRVPATEPLPRDPGQYRVSPAEFLAPPEMTGFRLSGAWLVARLGDRHLIAFDLKCRRVAWVLGTSGHLGFVPHAFPDALRLGPTFALASGLVVAQLSDGRRWFVRLESGKVLDVPGFEQPTAKAWWPVPPAEVEGNRLAVSDGPGTVRLVNLSSGRVRWTHNEGRDTSLSGTPPQVRGWGPTLLIAVSRNHGVELDRLDPATGRSAWNGDAAFLDAAAVSLENADADDVRVFVPAGKLLTAVCVKDGKTAWEAELPDTRAAGGWVVRAGQQCVIAYPANAVPREPVATVFTRVARSFRNNPDPARLPGLFATLYDAWVARSVPVLLFDPETGRRLNRFDVPALGPSVTAWFERDLAVVATGDRVCWLR